MKSKIISIIILFCPMYIGAFKYRNFPREFQSGYILLWDITSSEQAKKKNLKALRAKIDPPNK